MSEKEIRENLGRLLDEELKTKDFSFLNHYPEKSAPGKIDGILSKLQDYFSDIIYTPGETDFVEVVRSNAEAERKIYEFYNPISALEYAIDTAKHDKGKDSERKFVQNLLCILKYELRRREVTDYHDSFWYGENRSFWNLANVSWWFAEKNFSEQVRELLSRDCLEDLSLRESEILLVCMSPLMVDEDFYVTLQNFYYADSRRLSKLDIELRDRFRDCKRCYAWKGLREAGGIDRARVLSATVKDLNIIPGHIRKAYDKAKRDRENVEPRGRNIRLIDTGNQPSSFPNIRLRHPLPPVAPVQVNRANTADNVNLQPTANQETDVKPADNFQRTGNAVQGNVKKDTKTKENTKTQDNTKTKVITEDAKTDSLLKKAAKLQAAVEEVMPNMLNNIPRCVEVSG